MALPSLAAAVALTAALVSPLPHGPARVPPRDGSPMQEVAVVQVEENLRATPNGERIGTALPGTTLEVRGRQGRWLQVGLSGVVWMRSLQEVDREGFDLVVSEDGGENLRAGPQGTILARLVQGALLRERERLTGWIRIERTAWIWAPSVRIEGSGPATGERGAAPAPSGEWRRVGPAGAAVLTDPDGDTLAGVRPRSEVRVLGRDGGWARVRIEGWVWLPEDGESQADSVVLTGVTPTEVTASPDRYRGRLVDWELRFVSLERADRLRSDFYEGEPYLLARSTDDDETFVYVAVPAERVRELEGLAPLERIRVVGRIRTPRASLTGSPIVDLMEWTRRR